MAGNEPAHRVALVTGAGRNIGRAIALGLAEQGADIVLNVRHSRAEAESVAEEVEARGARALVSIADVSDAAAVRQMFEHARKDLGPVAILVNNAAVRDHSPIGQLEFTEWRRVLAIILDGAFLCSQAAIHQMREVGWGRIVNIAGISGQAGAAQVTHLAAAKAGLIGLTKALAVELAAENITVNSVSPGMIDTVRHAQTSVVNPTQDWVIPMKRRGTPAECAAAVSFLASQQASFITGQTLSVNGGTHIA